MKIIGMDTPFGGAGAPLHRVINVSHWGFVDKNDIQPSARTGNAMAETVMVRETPPFYPNFYCPQDKIDPRLCLWRSHKPSIFFRGRRDLRKPPCRSA